MTAWVAPRHARPSEFVTTHTERISSDDIASLGPHTDIIDASGNFYTNSNQKDTWVLYHAKLRRQDGDFVIQYLTNDEAARSMATPFTIYRWHYEALCCRCGNHRFVKGGGSRRGYQGETYSPEYIAERLAAAERDDSREYWLKARPWESGTCELKCTECRIVTRHALVSGTPRHSNAVAKDDNGYFRDAEKKEVTD